VYYSESLNIEITIPVFNEELSLEKKVLELYDYILTIKKYNITIILADNGSTDKTSIIGKKLSENLPLTQITQ